VNIAAVSVQCGPKSMANAHIRFCCMTVGSGILFLVCRLNFRQFFAK